MLTLDEPSKFTLFALASILVSLAAIPVAFTRAQAPEPIATVRIRFLHLYRLSPVGVVGCLAVGLTNGSFWALGPVFAQGDEMSTAAVALFMSTVVIAGALGQWPLGRLSDRIDRRKVIALASVGAALAAAGVVFISAQAWERGVLVSAFVFGLFAFPLYSLNVAHMNDFVDPQGYVEAAGGLLLVYALGAVAGPLIASLAVRYFGIDSLFAYTALIHLANGLFAVYRMNRRAPVPKEEQITFADALRVAQTVSNVDCLPPTPENQQAPSPPKLEAAVQTGRGGN